LLNALGGGDIDVALVTAVPGPAPAPGGFERVELFRSAVSLLAPRGWTIPEDPHDLLRCGPWISLHPDSAFRQHVQGAGPLREGVPGPAIEVGNLSLVLRFVEAGLGVALVPDVAFAPEELGAVQRVALPRIGTLRYESWRRAGGRIPAVARQFLELLAEPPLPGQSPEKPPRI
jgi:DNA-binding transcriptional LysR family regulator